jgi:hypothetical protein
MKLHDPKLTGSIEIQNPIPGTSPLTSSWAINVVNGGGSLTVADEGTAQGTATFLNFIGSGVTAAVASNTASITITGGSGTSDFPYTGSAIISGSLIVTGSVRSSFGFTGSLLGTSSWAVNSSTASYVLNSVSSSFASASSFVATASWANNAVTASYVRNSISSSYTVTASSAETASSADVFTIRQYLELQQGSDPGTANVSSSYFFVTASADNTKFNLKYRNNGALWETHWLEERTDTGIVWGGVLTFTNTTMSITPGAGLIINHNANTASHGDTVATYVPFGPITASAQFITSSQVTYLLIDENGQLVQQTTPYTSQQYNEKFPLGYIFCLTTSSISSYADARVTTYGQTEQDAQFIRAFGPLKISGYDISSQTGSLKISIASGQSYRYGGFYSQNPDAPSIYDSSAVATGSLVRVYRDPAVIGGFRAQTNGGLPFTDIDPTKWDDGSGTLQSVGASQWTIQRVFQGVVNSVSYVYYGQNVYDSLALALQSITTDQFVESQTSILALPFIGYIIAKGDATNLSDTTNNRIIQAGLFRNTAGSSGGGGAAAQSLEDLSDVTIAGATNGQALIYNSGLWTNGIPSSASFASTASFVTGSIFVGSNQARSASYAITSSFSLTASYALNAGSSTGTTFPYTGSAIISGSLIVTGSFRTLAAGTEGGAINGNVNNYLEFFVQNSSNGLSASTDIVAYNDTGNKNQNYVDMGINSSGISSTYSFGKANDAYVYNTGGDLFIGNSTAFYQPSLTSQSLHLFSNALGTPDLTITGSRVGIQKSGSLNATLDVNGNAAITGSLRITTSTLSVGGFTGSLFGTASYVTGSIFTSTNQALTASYALTASFALNSGGGGLLTKAGSVTNTSFAGNPRKATVTFGAAFPDTNYAITITGEDSRTWTIESKLAGSFIINANSNVSLTGTTYWIATEYGETT